MKIPIFPGKYHQNGGFSMAMLVYRRVTRWELTDPSYLITYLNTHQLMKFSMHLFFVPLFFSVINFRIRFEHLRECNQFNASKRMTLSSRLVASVKGAMGGSSGNGYLPVGETRRVMVPYGPLWSVNQPQTD